MKKWSYKKEFDNEPACYKKYLKTKIKYSKGKNNAKYFNNKIQIV